MEFLNQNRILLCCRKGSCPIIEKTENDEFTIEDDYQGKVRMSREHLMQLKNAIEHFEKPDATV